MSLPCISLGFKPETNDNSIILLSTTHTLSIYIIFGLALHYKYKIVVINMCVYEGLQHKLGVFLPDRCWLIEL